MYMYVYIYIYNIYNWITLLYTWNKHNLVDQLYSYKSKMFFKSCLFCLKEILCLCMPTPLTNKNMIY